MSFLSYVNVLVFFFNSLGIYKWLLLEGIGMDLVIFGGDTSFFFEVFAFLHCLLHFKS